MMTEILVNNESLGGIEIEPANHRHSNTKIFAYMYIILHETLPSTYLHRKIVKLQQQ
jgi:hypothetical protein